MTEEPTPDGDPAGAPEAAPAEGATPPGPPARRALGRAAFEAALVIVLVAAVVVAGVQWRHAHHLSSQERDRRAVATAAGSLADAILSYDASDLQQSRDRVLRVATDQFVRNYDQNFTQALGGSITALAAKATATVRDVYVADIGPSAAKAIVVVDFHTSSKSGTRDVTGTHLEMDLVRQNGVWKVDVVNLLALSSETQTPVFSPTTTTTPAVPGH